MKGFATNPRIKKKKTAFASKMADMYGTIGFPFNFREKAIIQLYRVKKNVHNNN
jgi:hypothetical protein